MFAEFSNIEIKQRNISQKMHVFSMKNILFYGFLIIKHVFFAYIEQIQT